MKLFAKKPCSFNGIKYFIGDEIPPADVLDPKAQEKMGVLVVVGGDTTANPDEGGPLLPPSPTLENHHTKETLSAKKKEELIAIAAEMGLVATESMRKDSIINMIIEKQGE